LGVKQEGLCSLRSHDPFWGCLTKKKPCRAARVYGLYYFHTLQKQAFDGIKNNKALVLCTKAFSL